MKKYIILFFVGILFSACDNYLDIEPKGRKILETTEEYSALLENDFNFEFPHDDIGWLVDERWVMNESWVIEDLYPIIKANFTFDESADRAKFIETDRLYNNCYKRIAQYNVIIQEIDGSEGDASLKEMVKAQAKILRAYNFFYLVNFYAKHYESQTASSDNGVILSFDFDMEAVLNQYSVQEVYDAIEKDINESLEFVPENAENTFRPGKAFAYALKAKVHSFKKEFDLALTPANESLKYNNEIYDMVNFAANPWGNMVGYDMPENNLHRYGRSSMGLSLEIVGPEFLQKFETGDTRLEAFFRVGGPIMEGCQYYHVMDFLFKYNSGGMRSVESLLMKAECLARKGDYQAAMNVVNELRVKRIKPANYIPFTASNTKEAMDIIIAERARELYLTPNRYWDLKRLNTEEEYAVTLTRNFNGETYTLKPNSHLYIHPFSVEALSRNINLKQNSK